MIAAAVAVLLILATGAAQPAQAQVESVIHSFGAPSAGMSPMGDLIRDSSGNLYGTTSNGGTGSDGTVFEEVYNPTTKSYTEKVLFSFNNTDGAYPTAGLIMDSKGNLYGTAAGGGLQPYQIGTFLGNGLVFELSKASGYSSEKVLVKFNGSNGLNPDAGLTMDSSGNLYGTTQLGGSQHQGTVFELTQASGYTTEKVLYSFGSVAHDGLQPFGGLIMDLSGNLYGTTRYGGSTTSSISLGDGTVFELTKASGYSSEKVLVNFNGANGEGPEAGLTMDSSGNLYGTTFYGGSTYTSNASPGDGTVFELTQASGYSSEKVLVNFTGANGYWPQAGLTMDLAGNLYGTTFNGGSTYASNASPGDGMLFELTQASGYSGEKVLVNFTGANGEGPEAGLTMDPAGNFYGTTMGGGSSDGGTVFGIAPVTLSSTSLSFGSVAVGSTSAAQTVTVTNTGTGQFSYSAASLSGANAADFTISSNTCSTAVAPGATCTVSVTFTPSTGTAETATLSLSQGGMTQTISLSGTGVYPTATLSPNLTFPETLVGTSSSPQTVTLTNTSTSVPLTISSISVSTNFTQTSTTCGSTLAAGTSCTIDVAFAPTISGSLKGKLTVTDNTSSGSQSVTLYGTGLTTVQYVQDVMIPQVESLGLNGGQTHSLVKELQDAAKLISESKISGAIGNLEQFIAEVNDLAGSGILTPTQASTLIGEANSVIKQLE